MDADVAGIAPGAVVVEERQRKTQQWINNGDDVHVYTCAPYVFGHIPAAWHIDSSLAGPICPGSAGSSCAHVRNRPCDATAAALLLPLLPHLHHHAAAIAAALACCFFFRRWTYNTHVYRIGAHIIQGSVLY